MCSFSCALRVDMMMHLYVYCHVRMELFGVGSMWVSVFINVRYLVFVWNGMNFYINHIVQLWGYVSHVFMYGCAPTSLFC